MIELDKSNYFKVLGFAEASSCNRVYPLSIIEGSQSGQVFVDSLENISSVLFWHQCGFSYLSGNATNSFLSEIADLIRNKENQNPRRFILQVSNSMWDNYFSKESGIVRGERYSFSFGKADFLNNKLMLPAGFEISEIDKNLLKRITGNIVPSFSWNSEEEFLNNGKGFCALYGSEIAAVAFSSAVSHDEIDIGIETKEKFRGCGLAGAVAKRMVQYVLEENKTPVWECHTGNKASKRTAEKVGFVVRKIHPFFKKCI